MNEFGRLFRVEILGESHGAAVGVVIDGCPAGVPLAAEDFETDLARRRAGASGTTARREADLPRLVSGVHDGHTTGAPILVEFENADVDSAGYERFRHRPRPGHADLVARQKYGGFNDPRGGGHFSGRLTVGLVAAGVIAKRLLPKVRFWSAVELAGGLAAGDSVGGVVECRVEGLPSGLGEPFFDSLESLIAHGAFAIPAVKGIEFGEGFRLARMTGAQAADAIMDAAGRLRANRSGGADGGLSNGNPLVFRVAVKPASSRGVATTVDLRTGRSARVAIGGRHDTAIAVRVPPIVEAVAAIVIADLMLLDQRIPRVWPGARRRTARRRA